MSVIVFLSAVSSEFHERDPNNPRSFASYRDNLALALRRLGTGYSVIVQEELAQGGGDLLQTLDREVETCACVVHLVGNAAGTAPESASVRRLRTRHPNLLEREPELAESLRNAASISYTQWELYLAFHHGRSRFVFLAEAGAPRSPMCRVRQMESSQVQHVARIKLSGEHREGFDDQRDLALKVVTSIVRFGLAPAQADIPPNPDAIRSAQDDAEGLVDEIAAAIRKPDPVAAAALDPTGVEVFLRALDIAALKRELDRRSALEIVHGHRNQLRATTDATPTAEQLYRLAFAELALGHYADAMAAAERCADLAATDESGQEDVLNAYLLLHDAANAASRRDEALIALEKGGALIDKTRDPILWADFHEQLAEFLLDQARFSRAETLIDEITDIREEQQPEQPALAKSLLLWCRLLHEKADYRGVETVATRAERIYLQQTPPELNAIASASRARACALLNLGRFREAEPLMRRTLAIDEQSCGAEHPNVVGNLNNLALLYCSTNRLAEAEPLMRRALAIDEQSYGTEHPRVAADLNNLALLLRDTQRLAEAEPLMRRALVIFEQSYGAEHPNVAVNLNNLAQLLQVTNRLAEAEPLMRRALAIDTQSYGAEHPTFARDLNNLAGLLQAKAKEHDSESRASLLAEAEPLMRRALAIDEQSYGAEHPNVALKLWGLVVLLRETDRLGEALILMKRSVAIYQRCESQNGFQHPDWDGVLWYYRQMLQAAGCAEAEIELQIQTIPQGENT